MSIPPPNACDPVDIHFHCMLPEIFTHPQCRLWWMSMGKVIASCWSTLGKSSWPDAGWLLDHYLLMAYSCCGLNWVGLVHLSCVWQTTTHKGKPVCGARRNSQLQCRIHHCLCWSIPHMRGSLSQSDAPPHEACPPTVFNLPLSLKGISLH